MTPTSDPDDAAATQAARKLARLNSQVDALRAVLVRLLQDVVVAESALGTNAAAQLLEANEKLVVSALRNQVDAETASQALDQVARSADLDALTQLPNRVLLLDRLMGAIASGRRHGKRFALLFLDLDKFKEINDSLGHAVGDEALRRVARCLASSVRGVDTVSRYGGDEFVVLLAEVVQPSDALFVAGKILALLKAPSHIGEHVLQLSASIGISIYPEDGEDALTLIEHADAAMYRAKRRGAGSSMFHADRVPDDAELEPPAQLAWVVPTQATGSAQTRPSGRHAELQEANELLVLAALSAQELQDAMQETQRRQTEFLNQMANELRDPLAPIRLAAAQLGRSPGDASLLPRAQAIIERQTAHMARLVDQLLDMTCGNARLRFRREHVDLSDVIEAAVKYLEPSLVARRQNINVKLNSRPLPLHGHPAHLAQIVSNLLDNASKYTPDGGAIDLSASMVGDRVVITVHDNGLGLAPEALLSVFDPFVQDTHAFGLNGSGVGIGLTVVRELVEAHGGSVVASSSGRGQGSQFVVTLPASTERRGPPASTA
ncbi:MAG: diguanylate cyclase [Burkholderiales bacterium]|nr:diguanylate cyclase [Burkholderiales bacterium]